jgi:CheY-like chemotaxis protein
MKVTDFTMLLVEDDPNDILLIHRAFAKASLVNPLKIVRDGEEALSYLAGTGDFADRGRYPLPSLILLDLKLPRKSGLEVLEWVRRQPGLKHIPVIVLTSSKESSDISRAYALGANSYLVKPVGFEGLLELVKTIGMYWIILNKGPEAPTEPQPSPVPKATEGDHPSES